MSSTSSISQIRERIASEVRDLVKDLPLGQPTSVSIGYITNSHRGYPVYQDGETIEGLPVQIDASRPNEITVRGEPAFMSLIDNTASASQ